MSRSTIMTAGFLLVLIGVQFYLVKSYTLTPTATKFWAERLASPADLVPLQTQPVRASAYAQNTNPYYQASYSNTRPLVTTPSVFLRPKQITPPDWICWPCIFVGVVLSLQGILVKR